MNLLNETLESIKMSNHSITDIVFIGSKSGYTCSWKEFEKMADKDYDKNFGAPKVAQDLVIIFSDKQEMRRGEYDGSEWWEYSIPFQKPQKLLPITCLFAQKIGWKNLSDIHE